MPRDRFSERLLAWYDSHGRQRLPWKSPRDPYRVWVSEIMLQQTQVATVIPYFERFMQRFPDTQSLARARLDSVLALWSGLGYYARARNLHDAAKRIARDHGGRFPRELEQVMQLPGVGRSTAGAILALTFDQRHPILDGNVRRVLARYHALDKPLNTSAAAETLWELAERHTPGTRVADYTQAIMDLGATVCRRTPECGNCPLARGCAARRLGDVESYPRKAGRPARARRHVRMLMIRDERNRVLLMRRPPTGIWGGLWGFPECANRDVRRFARATLGFDIAPARAWPAITHGFSHFELVITPVPARLVGARDAVMENVESVWYKLGSPPGRGLAAPVQRLLEQLSASRGFGKDT